MEQQRPVWHRLAPSGCFELRLCRGHCCFLSSNTLCPLHNEPASQPASQLTYPNVRRAVPSPDQDNTLQARVQTLQIQVHVVKHRPNRGQTGPRPLVEAAQRLQGVRTQSGHLDHEALPAGKNGQGQRRVGGLDRRTHHSRVVHPRPITDVRRPAAVAETETTQDTTTAGLVLF